MGQKYIVICSYADTNVDQNVDKVLSISVVYALETDKRGMLLVENNRPVQV